jgi:hypothetical protein
MAKGKINLSPLHLAKQLLFLILGALLTGFLTVFFAKFLDHYVPRKFAVAVGVGGAVALSLWVTQLVKNPPFLLKGVSPLIAGFCAGLGVFVAQTWLQ